MKGLAIRNDSVPGNFCLTLSSDFRSGLAIRKGFPMRNDSVLANFCLIASINNFQILKSDIKVLIRLMIVELKNLRSQVSRAAGQAFAELYLHLGKAMEQDLEKQVIIINDLISNIDLRNIILYSLKLITTT